MTKERPILFSAPMVRAILDGSKTQTRRVVKQLDPAAGAVTENAYGKPMGCCWAYGGPIIECPFGQPGDRLWVRETWLPDPDCDDDSWDDNTCSYVEWSGCGSRIDGVPMAMRKPEHCIYREGWDGHDLVWRPSIHMPRWASRILLEVVSVRVERLNDCSEKDAQAEGITPTECTQCDGWVNAYSCLWEHINGVGTWDTNPWVWVVEFKRVMS